MQMTGARIFWECLKREKVDTVFGYPGGVVLDIYHELSNHPEINHILVRHEQGGVHAADGYARASGKVGVALVTSGPGATNTVTGIATAYMDSVPMVVFTGQVPVPLIGNDAFQEVDIVGITRPCTKHNYLVRDVKDLAPTIKEAFHLAATGRPGPVLVDIPKDIIQAKTKFAYPEKVHIRSYQPHVEPSKRQLQKAVKFIKEAKRPLLYIGGGVVLSDSSEELTTLARKAQIPVTATLMGLGAYPGDDPLWLGMLGMHGTYAANMAVDGTDLLIAVGARFDDRVTGKLSTFAKKAKIIHVDVDPTSIRKNVDVHVPVVSDCKPALQGFIELIDAEPDTNFAEKHGDWITQVKEWATTHPLNYEPGNGEVLKPQAVVEKIYELTKGDAIITTEVGQNQMWTAQFYKFHRPRTLLTSGGLGTMGYGFPAAIGAQMAFPDKLVIDVAGDGSIQMNIQEMATAVCNNLPVKIVILNNGFLGMVRQWQELFYERNYCTTCLDYAPDFVALARSFGAEGFRVEDPSELEATLKEAFVLPKPVIVDVPVAREEGVYPMVPAGASLSEMLLV